IMRFICAVEGFSGLMMYLVMLYFLLHSQRMINTIYLVPIDISSFLGVHLCVAIAFMNFNHIFYDGTLTIPLVGPTVQFVPKVWRDCIYEPLRESNSKSSTSSGAT
ncbi:hypothetical protein PENTCL1PPCAC_15935, partial [Pristionchus entomophagus]